jgi:hypothetical protein
MSVAPSNEERAEGLLLAIQERIAKGDRSPAAQQELARRAFAMNAVKGKRAAAAS